MCRSTARLVTTSASAIAALLRPWAIIARIALSRSVSSRSGELSCAERANPRRVVRLALVAMLAGTVVLLAAIDEDASAEIVTVPLLLLGLGIGALASQLGSVTVSAVPDELSPEVGGLQNTVTNIGASLGTALADSARRCGGALLLQTDPDATARI
jgi:MFS family permease